MEPGSDSPADRYAAVVAALAKQPRVLLPTEGAESPRRFGSAALKIQNKIFAMLVRGQLVVKLPRQRVDALVASGSGERYDPRGDGRVMREWLAVAPGADTDWIALAAEAMRYVDPSR